MSIAIVIFLKHLHLLLNAIVLLGIIPNALMLLQKALNLPGEQAILTLNFTALENPPDRTKFWANGKTPYNHLNFNLNFYPNPRYL